MGLLIGLTPTAWFSMSVVNPSAVALGGGAALWAATLIPRSRRGDALLVAAWLAVLLPRRDGPLWATLIVLFAAAVTQQLPSDLWRRLGTAGRAVVLLAVPLPLVPLHMSGTGSRITYVLALLPLVLPIIDIALRGLRRVGGLAKPRPVLLAGGAVGMVAFLLLVVNVLRGGGPNTAETWRVIGTTGSHLREMFGNLGWLDTPPPESALLLWWCVVGGCFFVAVIFAPRFAWLGATALGAAIVAAWVSLLGLGTESPNFQGRYSVPFVLGVPMVMLGGIALDPTIGRRLHSTFVGAIWFVWNGTFYQAMRRWGAGVDGSVYPWRWITWGSPGHPLLFIILHAAFSAVLLFVAIPPDRMHSPGPDDPGILDGS